jgi:hypothetical protein
MRKRGEIRKSFTILYYLKDKLHINSCQLIKAGGLGHLIEILQNKIHHHLPQTLRVVHVAGVENGSSVLNIDISYNSLLAHAFEPFNPEVVRCLK